MNSSINFAKNLNQTENFQCKNGNVFINMVKVNRIYVIFIIFNFIASNDNLRYGWIKNCRRTLVESKNAGFAMWLWLETKYMRWKIKIKIKHGIYITTSASKVCGFFVIRATQQRSIDRCTVKNMKQFNVLLADIKCIKHINHKP